MMRILVLTAVSLALASGCGSDEPTVREEVQETAGTEAVDVASEVTVVDNTICPVMRNTVAAGQHFDWEGYRIGICCPGCESAFRSNPEVYIPELLEDPGVSEELKAELSTYLETAPSTE